MGPVLLYGPRSRAASITHSVRANTQLSHWHCGIHCAKRSRGVNPGLFQLTAGVMG